MLISVLQTLAEILAGGTSLTSTEQIDFSRPGTRRDEGAGPLLNLYLYDIRESKQVQHSGRQVDRRLSEGKTQTARVSWTPDWFDVALLLTAWDRTTLGEHHLLTEAMAVLLRHRSLHEDFLTADLRGYGNLSLSVSATPPIELGALWSALSVPLRPAVYITVTVPFATQSAITPRVWERIIHFHSDWGQSDHSQLLTRRVAIAGMVKSTTTAEPLPHTEVTIAAIDKHTSSSQDGLFFFDELPNGTYTLNLHCPGYLPRTCTVLVDGRSAVFKEISLAPTPRVDPFAQSSHSE